MGGNCRSTRLPVGRAGSSDASPEPGSTEVRPPSTETSVQLMNSKHFASPLQG